MKLLFTFVILIVFSIRTLAKYEVTCIGKAGKKIDWYIIYKMPKIKGPYNVRQGLGMMYMDSRSPRWRLLKKSLKDQNQPLFNTLNQLYARVNSGKTDDLAYVLYNDRTASNKMSSSKAHAKGAIFFDKNNGFWLTHSVPAFPPTKNYSYPKSGQKYGQMFMCVSLDTNRLDTLATYLQYINPQVYYKHIGPQFKDKHQQAWDFIKKNKKVTKRHRNYTSIQGLKTSARNEFLLFAKSSHYGKDLYNGLVAPTLHTNLLTETWLNGNGDYESVCQKNHSVKNILKLKMMKMSFINSQDHAKWGVSDEVVKTFTEETITNRKVLNLKYQKNHRNMIQKIKKFGYSIFNSQPDTYNVDRIKIMSNFTPFNFAGNVYNGNTKRYGLARRTKKSIKKKLKKRYRKKPKENLLKEIDGVDVKENAGWVCVGDINRQRPQSRRGGGTLCLHNERAWKSFHDLVVSVEGCNNKEIFV